MNTLTLSTLGGLCLGGIIHIVAVLAVPVVTDRTPWNGIAGLGPTGQFHLVTRDDTPVGVLDPAMVHAVCAFDLAGESNDLALDLDANLWTLSVFDALGRSVFALAGRESRFGMSLVTVQEEEEAADENAPEAQASERDFAARVPDDKGFIVLRAYSPHLAERDALADSLKRARCT